MCVFLSLKANTGSPFPTRTSHALNRASSAPVNTTSFPPPWKDNGLAKAHAQASRECASLFSVTTASEPESVTPIIRNPPSAPVTARRVDLKSDSSPSRDHATHVVIQRPPPPHCKLVSGTGLYVIPATPSSPVLVTPSTPSTSSTPSPSTPPSSLQTLYNAKNPRASACASTGPASVVHDAGAHASSKIALVSSGFATGAKFHLAGSEPSLLLPPSKSPLPSKRTGDKSYRYSCPTLVPGSSSSPPPGR
mmetsp:Transcript_4363/g.14556  ORF Transcript_4363/g.14556 Transcript_4363/m.14556 type:complete len:250 (+) Transcript_4363:561-1310(+)